MHHPWRRFRDEWGHVNLTFKPLEDEFHALTDGKTVWMDPYILQVEKRCAIAHEIVHLERGEHCKQGDPAEVRADRMAAGRLVPLEALTQAIIWSDDLDEVADEL